MTFKTLDKHRIIDMEELMKCPVAAKRCVVFLYFGIMSISMDRYWSGLYLYSKIGIFYPKKSHTRS